jgi:hypothetical protein
MARLCSIFIAIVVSVYTVALSSQSPAPLKVSPTLAVTDPGSWKSIQKGIDFRKLVLERAEPSYAIELKLIRFDTERFEPRLLRGSQFQLKGMDVKTFAEKSGAIAAINANYFDTEGKPLAFLKVGGQVINSRVAMNSLYTGAFAVKDRQPSISHRDDLRPEQIDEGLQSGPLLLLGGAAQTVTGISNRASRRALIGIDKERRLIIGATFNLIGGLLWPELQEIFSAAALQIQTVDLLNLDGGGSAQFYIKAGKFEALVPGTTEVPVAIGIFSKGN